MRSKGLFAPAATPDPFSVLSSLLRQKESEIEGIINPAGESICQLESDYDSFDEWLDIESPEECIPSLQKMIDATMCALVEVNKSLFNQFRELQRTRGAEFKKSTNPSNLWFSDFSCEAWSHDLHVLHLTQISLIDRFENALKQIQQWVDASPEGDTVPLANSEVFDETIALLRNPHEAGSFYTLNGIAYAIMEYDIDEPNWKTKWISCLHEDPLVNSANQFLNCTDRQVAAEAVRAELIKVQAAKRLTEQESVSPDEIKIPEITDGDSSPICIWEQSKGRKTCIHMYDPVTQTHYSQDKIDTVIQQDWGTIHVLVHSADAADRSVRVFSEINLGLVEHILLPPSEPSSDSECFAPCGM